jgi:O-methyltransferase
MNRTLARHLRRVANSIPMLRIMRALDNRTDNRLSERGMITQALEFTRLNGIQGDYFEFGLWRGKTFMHAYKMKKLLRIKNMHHWGFDSFAGLPAVPTREGEIWQEGQFSCSQQEFGSILSANGVQPSEYTLVAGFYDQSLNPALHAKMTGRKAAIIYIDCDLYESTVPVLEFVKPYLQNGTVMCFDDYYCYAASPDQGEQLAIAEFLAKHSDINLLHYLTYSPVGQSFIVRHRIPRSVSDCPRAGGSQ